MTKGYQLNSGGDIAQVKLLRLAAEDVKTFKAGMK